MFPRSVCCAKAFKCGYFRAARVVPLEETEAGQVRIQAEQQQEYRSHEEPKAGKWERFRQLKRFPVLADGARRRLFLKSNKTGSDRERLKLMMLLTISSY